MRRLVLSTPLLLLAMGCEHAQSVLYPEGPAASRIAGFSWRLIVLFMVITIIMWALVALAAWKRRGTLAECGMDPSYIIRSLSQKFPTGSGKHQD